MDKSGHIPVLPEQVMSVLSPRAGHVYLDCTLGRGGHASLIGPRLMPGGRLIGLDADPANVDACRPRLASAAPGLAVDLCHANFIEARAVLDDLGVEGCDLLLADLGFASTQMADAQRGLSFQTDGPLDMRLDPRTPRTAADIVNHTPERELADLIYRYGEERLSRKIARKIVAERDREPIHTTTHLAEVVRAAFGRHGHGRHSGPERSRGGSGRFRGTRQGGHAGSRIDPATRTFMALRIAVNSEIEALEHLLASLPRLLRIGGTAAVISFHSLEDRMVKQAFRGLATSDEWTLITRKAMEADDAEVAANPRSRSAKLRAIRRMTQATATGL
jgi:16S rRNA (cytosine1402-N4)-methyltransferase